MSAVTIYTRAFCPFCTRAVSLLKQKGVDFNEIDAGMDPDNLPEGDKSSMKFGSGGSSKSKAWRDIWGAGQGVGSIAAVTSTAEAVSQLEREYHDAQARLARITQPFGSQA